jgi:hypothetical protein
MIDAVELMGIVFSGLSALVIEDVEKERDVICVRARTRGTAVTCPGCGAETARVHEYRDRTAADVPVGGRRVLVRVRVRRMRCPVLDRTVQTFREQVPGVLDRYQRRISRLTAQLSAVARELAGRASARLLPALGIMVCRHTALRVLLKSRCPRGQCRGCPGSMTSRCAAARSHTGDDRRVGGTRLLRTATPNRQRESVGDTAGASP